MSAIGTKPTLACALHMSAVDPKRTSDVAVAHQQTQGPYAHTRTSSFPLLAATKPLKTSLTWFHDFSFFMLSSQRLMSG